MPLTPLQKHLRGLADPERAKQCTRYFKTAPGQTGAGRKFLGLSAPLLHAAAKTNRDLPLTESAKMLRSEWHEERATALLILVLQFPRSDDAGKKAIYDAYMDNTISIDAWDLVDCSAPHIVGAYLADRSKKPLDRLARSTNWWERRIAMLATQHYIRKGEFDDALRIAEMLLQDEEDLIHKAVGWMLREIGNRDSSAQEAFLREHYAEMPRTMLRYAIEKLPAAQRKAYLTGTV